MEKEELLKRAFQDAAIGMALLTVKPLGNYIEVNPAFCRMTGYSRAELLSKTFQSITDSQDLENNLQQLQALIKQTRPSISLEKRYLRKDNSSFWARLNISLVQDRDKKTSYLIVQIEDIDQRKRTEDQLQRSELFLNEAQRVAHIGNWNLDLSTKAITWSDELYRMFGLVPQESPMTFERFLGFIHPEDVHIVKESADQAIKYGKPFNENRRVIRPDGTVRHQNSRGAVEVDAEGRPVRLYGTVQDITEQKHVEERLRFMQFSVEQATDAVFWITPDSRIFDVNESACRALGYTREELLSMSVSDIDPDYPHKAFEKAWEDLKNRGSLTLETRNRAKSGKIFPVEIRANFLEFHGKEYNCLFARDISDRKEAEAALQESGQFNQQVIDNAREGIIVYDREIRYRVWNRYMEEMTGLRSAEVAGKKPPDLAALLINRGRMIVTHEVMDGVYASAKKALENETIAYFDVPWALKDGSTGWNSVHYSPFRNAQNEIVGVIATVWDITERKKSEDALLASEARFRSLIEQSPLSTQIFSPDGETVRVNRAWEELWGFSLEKIGGYNILKDPQLVKKGLMPFILKAFGGEATTIPTVLYDPAEIGLKGNARSVRGHIYPVKDNDGRVREVVLMHEDITEKVRAEEQAKRQTAALHELHAISTLPGLDDRKRCDEVVSAMASFFGVPVAAAKRFRENQVEIISIWNRGEIQNGLLMPLEETPSDAVRNAKTTVQFQGLLATQFPRDPFLSANAFHSFVGSPIFDSRGEVRGSLNLVHDKPVVFPENDLQILELFSKLIGSFMERADIEEQLRHAQKLDAIGQLTGGIAHEFNNLLTAIIGNLQLAFKKTGGNEELEALLSQSDQAAHRASLLTKQLLAFSRRAPMNPRPQNLYLIAEDVTRLLRQTIDRTITVTIESPKDLWPVLADAAQMHQMIMNLCVNARDALMEELARPERTSPSPDWKPRIQINLENISSETLTARPPLRGLAVDHVCLSVFDNGCGMDQDIQARIFEPFFTTKEVGRGTGLGLATVHGIVEQNNGWIDLTSGKNQSTIFKVYLPRTLLSDKPAPPVLESQTEDVAGGNETVLLVDDEASIRRLGQTVLSHYGYTVLLAGDGEEAVEIFTQNQETIGLVILDLTMPKRSGWDTYHDIRRIDPRARIIVSSGHRMDKRLKEMSHQEKVRFIPKPYRPVELAQIVREVLDRPVD